MLATQLAPVAQLDRATASGAVGQRFESSLAYDRNTNGQNNLRGLKSLGHLPVLAFWPRIGLEKITLLLFSHSISRGFLVTVLLSYL